jgi:hypothetical protein
MFGFCWEFHTSAFAPLLSQEGPCRAKLPSAEISALDTRPLLLTRARLRNLAETTVSQSTQTQYQQAFAGGLSFFTIRPSGDVLALDLVLSKFEATDPLAAKLVKLRFFTGLSMPEAAAWRQVKERLAAKFPYLVLAASDDSRELRPLLDQELNRLPAKYRVPVVLCYLEGKTRQTVARQLGWPEGTLSSRLATARKLLHSRLLRQGFTLSAGAVALTLAQTTASADLPQSLIAAVLKNVTLGEPARGTLATTLFMLIRPLPDPQPDPKPLRNQSRDLFPAHD